MKFKPFGSVVFLALVSVAPAYAGNSIFYSRYGTDGFLKYSSSRGCFVGLVGRCSSAVSRLNEFAVESGGTLYCDAVKTPVIDRPLVKFAGYGSNQRVISTCTSKGWKNLPF